MNSGLSLSKKGVILVSVPLILQFLVLGVLAALLVEADAQLKRENQAREVVESANRLRRTLLDSSIALAGFAYSKSWGTEFRYKNTARYVPERMQELERLAKNKDSAVSDKQRIDNIEKEAKDACELFEKTKEQLDRLPADRTQYALKMMHNTFSSIMDQIDKEVAALAGGDDPQAKRTAGSASVEQALMAVFAVSILLNVGTAYALALFFKTSIAARLTTLTDNYTNLAMSKPLSAPLQGDDEITALDKSFRSMAKALAEVHGKEKAMIENAVDVICSIDRAGKFRAVSLASEKLWGYPPDDLIGSHFGELIASSQKESVIESFRASMQPDAVLSMETIIKRKDQSEVEFSWSGCWSEADQSLFCVAHDVTERKKVEKMKSDFVAMVSHDLRSPLTAISMFLSMLSTGTFGELSQKVVAKAQNTEKDARRLIDMVNDLLDVERMEAGMFSQSSMNVEPVYVSEVVNRSCESVFALAEKKNIKIDKSVKEALVMADESRLIQVLVNLLSNAIKFSGQGATVSVVCEDSQDDVTINVKDNGPGISQSDQLRIFQRFERSDSTPARKEEGFGLGLAICKGIVEALGGTIGVESDGATGSCFFVTLPKVPLD